MLRCIVYASKVILVVFISKRKRLSSVKRNLKPKSKYQNLKLLESMKLKRELKQNYHW